MNTSTKNKFTTILSSVQSVCFVCSPQDLDDDLSDFGDCVVSSSLKPSAKRQELLKFEVHAYF